MKPLHIGLLAVGATLAGGLAFKLTQPPAISVAPAIAESIPDPALPSVKAPPSLQAPPAIAAVPAKPSPIPKPARPLAEAPAPIYAETRKPVLIAKVSPTKTAPTQWAPAPYEAPPAPAAVAKPEPLAPPPPAEPRQVTLLTGMTVAVRLDESLSSDRAAPGDTFQASLAEPLVVDNLVIAERGARTTGRIVDVQKGSRLGSPSILELALTSVITSDGQRLALPTDPWTKQADRNDDPIGAIFSRPKPATAPTATVIRFRLSSRVTVTEQIAAR